MKLDDTIWGAALVGFAVALYAHVRTFPAMPGQHVGPGALPTLLAAGLGVCGALLLINGLRRRAAAGADHSGTPAWFEPPEWFAHRPQLIAFVVLVGVNLFYLFAVQSLGFILTSVVYLTALMAV